jgi:hypothetical protein
MIVFKSLYYISTNIIILIKKTNKFCLILLPVFFIIYR